MASRAAQQPTITLPMPHAGQQAVLRDLKRFNWVCAGRRWRKTTLFMAYQIEQALTHPDREYVWSAPTYQQVRVGWAEYRRACGEVADFNGSRMEVTFPNKSVVHFVSLTEYDAKRGLTSFGTVIDEASEIPAAAYYEVLYPMATGTDGWLLAGGTPKGRNWFWEEWEKSADRRTLAARWQIPTVGCALDRETGRLMRRPHALENPDIAFEEMEIALEQLGERRFRQEFLAEFLDDAGGVFRNVRSNLGGELLRGPEPGHEYVVGVDLAKYQDYTVLVVMDVQTRRVVDFHRFHQADWNLQKARIIAIALHWHNALLWIDSTGLGDPICDDLQLAGLRISPYRLTAQSKRALIDHLALCIEQHDIGYPEIPQLLAELVAFEFSQTAAGNVTMSAPEGMHDDCVIALGLAAWGLGRGGASRLPPGAVAQVTGAASEIGGVRILRRTL
jgi:hypothetical protein